MSRFDLAAFRRRLLHWYRRHRRDLPWRRTRDPYSIVVSEFMLQQTQVATAVPYFKRFLARFPDVRRLAEAPEQDVLHAWAGLGYYRRARQLHRLARQVERDHGGDIPAERILLGGLPGVGPYTGAAVASIAFGLPEACVDGNVIRVLSRVFCEAGDPAKAEVRGRIAGHARAVLAPRQPGDWNQALMELGAVVCRPRAPACPRCPVRPLCGAFGRNQQERFPNASPRRTAVAVREFGAVILRRGRVLILQRASDDRWAGMWEFPHAAAMEGEAVEPGTTRTARELTGLDVAVLGPSRLVRYTFTHHRFALTWAPCRSGGGRVRLASHQAFRWVPPGDLLAFPLPSPHRRIALALPSAEARR